MKWLRSGRIGVIEESFISQIEKGDSLLLAGNVVELVLIKDMTAYVRKSTKREKSVPRCQGGRMSLSAELGNSVLTVLEQWHIGTLKSAELDSISNLLKLQAQWSTLLTRETFLIESVNLRKGFALYFYTFAGCLVN